MLIFFLVLNMSENKKVALVEIGGSHDECLMSQMLALKSADATVIWVTTETMFARCTYLHPYVDRTYFVNLQKKAWSDFRTMQKLVSFLKKEAVSKIIFNTAQGGNVRNLAFLLPKSIEAFGIIHTLRKFNGSFTQKLINRKIKKYFVLSDDLLKRTEKPAGLTITSFYPLDFPHFNYEIDKKPGDIWISLTGGVETRRKDLGAILPFIHKTPNEVKFIFLGKSDMKDHGTQDFLNSIKEEKLSDRVIWFENFVDQAVFDAYLKRTDFLLPLIHPDTPSAEQYINNQISGAFLLSFSYHIPMLIHHAYTTETDLQTSSYFYPLDNFSASLIDALQNKEKLIESIKNTEKWQPKNQHRNYLRFTSMRQNK